ncbi:MAG: electron transfer flavoprotein subunit alpha/FixB family protein [Conexivisphaera sp.]|jgi:electron transfer flavoprotein alpha subunit
MTSKVVVVGRDPQDIANAMGLAKMIADGSGSSISAIVLVGGEDLPRVASGIASEGYVISGTGHTPELISAALRSALRREELYAVVAPALKDLTDALARFSASLGIPMFTEVTEVLPRQGEGLVIRRAALAGRAVAEYSSAPPISATVAPGRFPAPAPSPSAQLKVGTIGVGAQGPEVLGVEQKRREGVDISSAEIVIGVGRGFRSKDDLNIAFRLAELLGGAVGCSRPIAADYGWLPEDRWIGISAKKIRPKLYLALGISGAPQHMSGVLDSKLIAAVNKDKNAPIFQYADYGVVGDLYQIVPALVKRLEELHK